jgi:predicted anti-sigma-YlaC factor YlaD
MMGPRICERESEVVRLARLPGEPPADLAAHLARCPDCREVFDVARYMIRLAADTDAMAATRQLPEPSQLWWKARLLQRWNAESRATAPLDWMQRIEVVGGVAAVVILLLMFWTDLRGGGSKSSAFATQFWPIVAGLLAPGALSSMIVGGLLLIGCLSLFTLRQLLVED